MRKTHLSLALSRAWATEWPVGDPHGGPAYGERNMPLIAVAAIYFGATAAAGVIAAGVITAASAFTMVAAVGAIAYGVGSLTGNKTLTKVGMVMGAVGGIGALAEGAGMLGSEAASTGDLVGNGVGSSSAEEVAAPGAAPIDTGAPVVDPGTAAPMGDTAPGAMPGDVAPASAGPVVGPSAPASTAAPGLLDSAGSAPMGDTNPGAVVDPTSAGGNWYDPLLKHLEGLKSNDKALLGYGAMQVGGAVLGSFSDLSKAQVAALKAQTQQTQLATAIAQQQNVNINRPLPVAQYTPPPNPYTPVGVGAYNQPGLLNGNYNGGNITGRPA